MISSTTDMKLYCVEWYSKYILTLNFDGVINIYCTDCNFISVFPLTFIVWRSHYPFLNLYYGVVILKMLPNSCVIKSPYWAYWLEFTKTWLHVKARKSGKISIYVFLSSQKRKAINMKQEERAINTW